MAGSLSLTMRDFSDEYSVVTIPIASPDPLGTDYVAWSGIAATLFPLINAISLCNIARFRLTAIAGDDNNTRPSNGFAQRELALRLFFTDNVNGKRSYLSIPGFDVGTFGNPGSDQVDLTLSAIAPLVAYLESVMQSVDGNPVTIDKGLVVGRAS